MSYFLSDKPLEEEQIIQLEGEEARHILLSRRIEVGEIIEVQGPAPLSRASTLVERSNVEGPDQRRFEAKVIGTDKRSPSSPTSRLTIQALKEIKVPEESPLRITIFQALIKEQPLDFIIQKTTELGVDKLVIFNSENSIERFKDMDKPARPDGRSGGKLARWRKIGEEAAKQSGRVRAVSIEYLDDVKDIEKLSDEMEHIFLLEPSAKMKFSTWALRAQVKNIGILVGPEGGFAENEVAEFSKIKNMVPISMGPRILRADTAAITSSAIAQALWGDI